MSFWLIFSLVILSLLTVILLVAAQYQSHSADTASQRRFYELLERNTGEAAADKSWTRGVIRRMGQSRLARWLPKTEQHDTVMLLKQAGWYSPTGRVVFYLSLWLLPVLLMLLVFILVLVKGELNNQALAQLFMAGALGFLMPKNILRRLAKSRRGKLSREMPTAVHLLRMLFDAGLSTEHALRVLHSEGELLTPELSKELKVALRQIDAGLDPADALAKMAAPLEVNELNDTVAILKQVSRYGGNIRETLVNFAQLMEDRQLSALREYVNVLSGKMSVVMMVFLFPALLIFLAGPGFMALVRGLSGAF